MNVLLIGLGSIAKKHIKALKSSNKNCAIYAFRRSESKTNHSDVINIYNMEAISNLKLDFAIIASPSYKHYNDISRLINLNIPLFIEKPLFTKINTETDNIISKIIAKNIFTYVACNLRFLECLNYIKHNINTKTIVEVNVYCGSYLPNWRPQLNYKDSYSANKNMGGGVHLDLIHEIDYIHWLFGYPSKVNKTLANKNNLKIDAVEYANYLFEYPKFYANLVLNYYRPKAKRTIEIVCIKDIYLINLLENKIYKNGKLIFNSEQSIENTYQLQIDFFIERIDLGKDNKHFNSIEEAYKTLQLCLN